MGLIATSGGVTLVDKEDEWLLQAKHWIVSEGRVRGSQGERLHHYIAGFPVFGYETDHINGNPLDNRRSNLELVSHHENVLRWAKTTRGYYWDKSRGCWQVSLTIHYRRINGGRFVREEDAQARVRELRGGINAD